MSSRKRITIALVGLIALVVIGWFVQQGTTGHHSATPVDGGARWCGRLCPFCRIQRCRWCRGERSPISDRPHRSRDRESSGPWRIASALR
ncbi:hypothetical protein [Saccharopolyspora gloriosae]|uniref:hypothetical protein n=1 Tax=Saccharopolyspora gloriosae TaxID=455344 RepID=UPI001FB77D49|nr:hypothetical protein [Saccharopolyspora gloriosae]